jgi:hypothetical protein
MPSTSNGVTGRPPADACAPVEPDSIPADRLIVSSSVERWLSVLIAGIVVEYLLFFVLFWDRAGPGDADQYLVFHSLQYWNAQLFGLAKQWTPLLCSGLSLAGEPQVPFLSLGMTLSYLLGPLWGVKFSLVLYCVGGWVGAYLYSGLWLRVPLQRRLAAALFVGNGFFFCRLGLGHFDFAPFLMLPLMLWALHRCSAQKGLTVALLAAAVAMMIDGSPVTLLHLMSWVGLYAVVLSVCTRQWAPALVLGSAGLVAAVLDAGYLWPMIEAQSRFPRLTQDTFTSALSLLWFAILPLRGKVLPANGNGHELTVYIGPVLCWCLWRSRHWLRAQLPESVGMPLLIVSIASVVLGMGSLRIVHVPMWLSPFDILRPLPGFRSIDTTGRYWGFLALPLSLLGAAALTRMSGMMRPGWRLHAFMGAVLVFQLVFQGESLSSHWVHSPRFNRIDTGMYFNEPESITYLRLAEQRQQGEVLTPVTGVCDCYDMDDFVRPRIAPTQGPVLQASWVGSATRAVPALAVSFSSWNRIEIGSGCVSTGVCKVPAGSRLRIVLAQAFHADWHAAACETYGTPDGNLAVECPVASLLNPVVIEYRNPLSDVAANVSVRGWQAWGCMMLVLIFGLWWRPLRLPSAAALDSGRPT